MDGLIKLIGIQKSQKFGDIALLQIHWFLSRLILCWD